MYREVYVTHFLFSPSKTKDRLTFGYIIFYHELPVKAEPTSQAVLLPASEQESALGHPAPRKLTFTKEKKTNEDFTQVFRRRQRKRKYTTRSKTW